MNKNSKHYRKVPLEISVQIRILHQECGYGKAKLQKIYPAFPRQLFIGIQKRLLGIYWHIKEKATLGHHERYKKRNERQIMRSMNKLMKLIETFSSMELQDHAGLARTCSNRTVIQFLNRNDFGFYQCRRKGQLTPEELDKRLKFCK